MLVPDCPAAAPTSSIWDEAVTQLIEGAPPWFPYGVPIVSTWQIPLIKSPLLDEIPEIATAYDKRGQTAEPASTILHGYVQDGKLRTQLTRPQEWVARFDGYWGVIAPDFSIRAEDPPDRRVFSVRMSRAVGAFYQSRGLRVVPNVRWCDSRDFDYCFLGVEKGSAIAISNHGCWRTGQLRQGFLTGLSVMIERLQPSAVFVHGTIDHIRFRQLKAKTEFVHLQSDRTRARERAA
jgi:hypothetical protein